MANLKDQISIVIEKGDDVLAVKRKKRFQLENRSSGIATRDGKNENITIEKVVKDIANVFCDLKSGITSMSVDKKKIRDKSVSKDIEEIYKRQKQSTLKRKEKEKAEKEKLKRNPTKSNVVKGDRIFEKRNNDSRQNDRKDMNKNQRPKTANEAIIGSYDKNVSKNNVTENHTQNPKVKRSLPNAVIVSNYSIKSNTQRNTNLSSRASSVSRSSMKSPSRENFNPLGILKDEVEKAKSEKKIFTVRGCFPAVRRALLKRGWIEKYQINYRENGNEEVRRFMKMEVTELLQLLRQKELTDLMKRLIKSKLLYNYQPDLYWDFSHDAYRECPDKVKLTQINRIKREADNYTTKQGMCQAYRESHWLEIPGVSRFKHPRSYILTKGGDAKTFFKDYVFTASICLMKWVLMCDKTGDCKIVSSTGKVPMSAFEFALTEIYKYIRQHKHLDLDEEEPEATNRELTELLEHFYKIVHVGNHFKLGKNSNTVKESRSMVSKASRILESLEEFMPNMEMDGYMNIWILKPTNSSRGLGIHICRSLDFILETVRKNPTRRYVVQKYIERPLLINQTKFDIRQWFMINPAFPLTIWMYKVCYLRFSSQTYNLRKLSEAIHLTNNSVQSKYLTKTGKDPLIPNYAMWDSNQFKEYLSNRGFPDVFNDIIYTGMKECIVGAILAHRDKIESRKNSFELYGADFMLDEKFEPWILEINSNPALHASTPITSRLCPQVLEDVIKVVVDHERDKQASTGSFEMIYKECYTSGKNDLKKKLQVLGCSVPSSFFYDIPGDETGNNSSTSSDISVEEIDPKAIMLKSEESLKSAVFNLIAIAKKERHKRTL